MSNRGPHTEETKEKMRQAHLNKRHTLGELSSYTVMPYCQASCQTCRNPLRLPVVSSGIQG